MSQTEMPKPGDVFVKEFFIVACISPLMPKGFFICGSGGMRTSSSEADGIFPCITTEAKEAREFYDRAREGYKHMLSDGSAIVLIKFTGGVIAEMDRQVIEVKNQ